MAEQNVLLFLLNIKQPMCHGNILSFRIVEYQNVIARRKNGNTRHDAKHDVHPPDARADTGKSSLGETADWQAAHMKNALPVLDIRPLEGIGPLRLGESRAAARLALAALGLPLEASRESVDYFCDACIQTECGLDERLWFIGVSAHIVRRFSVRFQGQDVFALSAPELFARMAAADNSGQHEFNVYEYCFPRQILTLWDADAQYDLQGGERRPVWAQVGVGNAAYAAACAAIKGRA
jgi:hypothetical protein